MISISSKNWVLDNIDTVLFDKDGTFIDLHFFWGKMTELRIEEIIKKYELSPDSFKQLCSLLGYDVNKKKMLSDGITALYSRDKIISIFNKNLNKLGIPTNEKELENIFDKVSLEFNKNIHNYTKPIESAIDFIKLLHSKGVKLGIVTSDSVKSTNLTINYFGWNNLFNTVIGRESINFPKESGMPIKLALNNLKSNPNNTIMVGDTPIDAKSAKNADIAGCILVSTGQVNIEELSKHSNYVINSFEELLAF